jgi:hypothetical protein
MIVATIFWRLGAILRICVDNIYNLKYD